MQESLREFIGWELLEFVTPRTTCVWYGGKRGCRRQLSYLAFIRSVTYLLFFVSYVSSPRYLLSSPHYQSHICPFRYVVIQKPDKTVHTQRWQRGDLSILLLSVLVHRRPMRDTPKVKHRRAGEAFCHCQALKLRASCRDDELEVDHLILYVVRNKKKDV